MNGPASDSRRILVIDDNEAIHDDFRKTLMETQGERELADAEAALFDEAVPPHAASPRFQVDFALQGQEGYQKAQQALGQGKPYCLAFVDMRMPPGWDGLETIRHLFDLDSDIQVVVCSAYSDYSWDQMFAKLGMTDRVLMLKKPFDPMEVSQLASALSEKWRLKRQAQAKVGELEAMVHARTHELRQQALRDRLTGLPNRAYVLDHLPALIAQTKRNPAASFALLFIDVDRFKSVNDSLGHEVGDELLVEIAARLQSSLFSWTALGHGGGGSFAARLGGDEFVVLLNKAGGVEAAPFAQGLIDSLATAYAIKGYDLHSSASIGVAIGGADYERGEEVIRDADTAMFRAKQSGRAAFVMFDRSMREEAVLRLTLEADLQNALAQDELEVCYQPIVALESGALVGFEALLRWNHAIRGLVMPEEFVAVAEETNLIIPIGQRVLERVCRQLGQWRARHPEAHALAVSVNVSRRQFADAFLARHLATLLEQNALPPGSLNLEITESVMMEQSRNDASLIRQFDALGIPLHMDDFGTGYSSLNNLHQMPLKCLKIHRSFIVTMACKRDYAAVICAIVQLAHNLGIEVIAEGVETREQATMLQALECDKAQGYFFAKPMSAADAEAFIRQHCPMSAVR